MLEKLMFWIKKKEEKKLEEKVENNNKTEKKDKEEKKEKKSFLNWIGKLKLKRRGGGERKRRDEKGIRLKRLIPVNFVIALVSGLIALLFTKKWTNALTTTIFTFLLLTFYFFIKASLQKSAKVKMMEFAFPAFLQLMSSNLRAGMTIDRALLISARKEFDPLDKEIMLVGKDIVTGKRIEDALQDMSNRIKSENIQKTLTLITSGILTGGNLAILLEETAANMRERTFVEKRAASNVLMYVIFIFFATAVGSPVLFALSSVLIGVLSNVLATVPDVSAISTSVSVPFTLSKINIPLSFVFYFALTFLIVLDVLGSFVLGLVSKGEERAGLRYIIPLISISITVFLSIRTFLNSYFSTLF